MSISDDAWTIVYFYFYGVLCVWCLDTDGNSFIHFISFLWSGHWTYTHTIRRPEINKESPELKMQISSKEYKVGALLIFLYCLQVDII